ncbi:MAG: Beta-lactamase hydrolase-like protein [Syntrophorhabdus sp. PtaB.Bin184]|jgi:sulfur dioxygenase|nr:MAG: Beta-lactamase hydrolase-like protein [Syntrophorhabdus sp. PtaB.Bin184]
MIFKQFNFDGCLAYVMACERERKGVIIDPSHEMDPFLDFVASRGLTITHIIDTHTHVDHVSLAPELADRLTAKTVMNRNTPAQRELGTKVTDLFGIEKVLAENALKRVDLYLGDGDELEIGDITLKAMETKGHTRDHMAILAGDRIFTGDVLIIGQCGRTDLPGGSSRDMYESLFGRIMPLSDDLIVYPAHDYRGNINSSLGYEKVNNVCLKTPRTVEEFEAFLKGLFPPLDAKTGKLQCGLSTMEPAPEGELGPLMKSFCMSMEAILATPREETVIEPEELLQKITNKERLFLVDVREPGELAETGFIEGAVNIPVREVALRIGELPKDLSTPVVVYCASGHRSSHAAIYLRAYGYRNTRNLEYGIHGWQDRNYPLKQIR